MKRTSTKTKQGLIEKAKKNNGNVFQSDSEFDIDSEEFSELLEELAELSFDPHELTTRIIDFGRALTGISLYDYQYEMAYRIIRAVVAKEGGTITILVSRQAGKSETVAFCLDTLCVILPALGKMIPDLEEFSDGLMCGLFAPQSDQVNTTLDRCLIRLGSDNAEAVLSDPEIDTELTSNVRLELSNGSFVRGQTASKTSKIESKTYHVVVIEEAQDTDDFLVQKSIEPMVTATNGLIIKVGTTGTRKCDFFIEIQENIRASRKIKDPRLRLHYEYDYKRVIKDKRGQYAEDGKKFHLNYEKDVLRKRAKWGETSDAFRLSYALIWALDSGMFFTEKSFASICNLKLGFPKNIKREWLMVAGLDIAKDDASTVMTIGYVEPSETDPTEPPKKTIVRWLDLGGLDYNEQHDFICEALIEYNIKIMYADYTGVGKPVVERIVKELGDYVYIVPYTFSRPSKSDMWSALNYDIIARRLTVPANKHIRDTPEFINFEVQAFALQKYYQGSYLVAEGLEEYDDYMDSLALFVMAGNEEIDIKSDTEVEILSGNPFMDTGVSDIFNPRHLKHHSW